DLKTLRKNLDEVREETIMDQLTMIGNRRHFDRSMEKLFVNHQLENTPLCLIMADIDHFKLFNDKWGHQTGDQVLRLVALAIKNNVKQADIPCRYGGEEFAAILPNTALVQGLAVAERIRQTVAKRDVVKRSTGENLGRITISAGVALLHPSDTVQSFIGRADQCLYAAKNAGRNRSITERDKVSISAA
ncbi:MAG: GGDEF domain-containing protein, partial [Pseudomonadota bacterium]